MPDLFLRQPPLFAPCRHRRAGNAFVDKSVELAVRVLPKQQDEFTCMSCFLVHHRSQLAREKNGQPICRDCD